MAFIVKCFANFFLTLLLIDCIFVITVGALILVYFQKVCQYYGNLYVGEIAIGIGIFMLIMHILGFVSWLMSNNCMVKTYIAIMSLIIGLSIGVGVYVYLNISKSGEVISNCLNDSLNSTKLGTVMGGMDYIQEKYQCCGLTNYEDWQGKIPISCCSKIKSPNCSSILANVYPDGCLSYVKKNFEIFMYVMIGVMAFSFVGSIPLMILLCIEVK